MVQWIAPLLSILAANADFRVPPLPPESRAVYHFNEPIRFALSTSESGAAFPLAVGFSRAALGTAGASHRDRGKWLLERISERLRAENLAGVTIEVARLYAGIGEAHFNVWVADASRAEAVKMRLVAALKSIRGVTYSAEPGRARVD
jgi:hypothetical protein